MADRKISDLTALTTPASGDYLPIVDVSEPAASNKNKRITIEELLRGAPDGTAAAPSFAFESDPDSGLYSAGANAVAISAGGTERVRIDSNGYLRLAGGGIQFNGDTAAVNALDDYEEGTFAPVLQFGGGSTGIAYIFRNGTYTKVGRKVHVIMEILLSAKGSSTGTASIDGLPFISSAGTAFGVTISACGNVSFTNGYLNGGIGPNSTSVSLFNTPTSGGIVYLSDTAFTDATGMRIDATYYV